MKKIININRNYMQHAVKSIIRGEDVDTVFRIWGDKGGIWISNNYACRNGFIAVRVRADGDHRGYAGTITASQCIDIGCNLYAGKKIVLHSGTSWLPNVEPVNTGGIVLRNHLCANIRQIFWEILHGLGENTEVAIAPWGILANNGKAKYISPLHLPFSFEPYYLPWPCWQLLADKRRIEAKVSQWIMPNKNDGRWAIVADDFVLSAQLHTILPIELRNFPFRWVAPCRDCGHKLKHQTTNDGIFVSQGTYGQFQV